MSSAQTRPPCFAERILRAVSPRDDAAWIASDLAEEMEAYATTHGERAARRWYWRQVLASIAPLLARRVSRRVFAFSHGDDSMWQDLRLDVVYAVRLSRRSALTTGAVIMTMILGIGVTTSVFSVVDAVMIRPLPFAASSRTVQLFGVVRSGGEIPSLAYPDLMDFRQRTRTVEAIGVGARATKTIVLGDEPQRLTLVEIDSAFVDVLGLRATSGRLFASDEFRSGAPNVVVLADGFRQRAFGADSRIVGRVVSLDGEPYRVVGILPEGAFTYPTTVPDAMIPLRLAAGTTRMNRGAMWAEAVARLRPGVTVDQAQRDLSAIAAQIAEEFKDANTGIGVRVKPLRDAVVGPAGRLLGLLSAAVAAVLLIACLNVGNLLLARASTRSREFAVRVAIGGSSARLRRQVLTESVLLALIGGIIGTLAAPILTHVLISCYPGELPRAAEVGMNWRVVVAAVGGTCLAALLASIPAMRRAGGHDLSSGLRQGNRDGLSRAHRRVAGIIVAAQIAASLMLFFIAGLVVQTFVAMNRVEPGFDPRGVVAFQVVPTPARHRGLEGIDRFYTNAEEALRRLPGVSEVSSMTHVPFFPGWFGDVFVREDKGDQGPRNPQTSVTAASPGFERALRLRVVAGRSFMRSDDSLAPRVVMINRALAASAFAGEDALGKTISWNAKDHWQIIGIVDDARDRSLIEAPPPMLYVAIPQNPRRGRYLVVRAATVLEELGPTIRRAMREIDPTVPLNEFRTFEDAMSRAAAAYRFRAWLMAGLGALACVLAIVGIYGIVSDSVARRTRDIGIRMALGQNAVAVQRDVLGAVLRLAVAGALLGVLGSIAAGRSVAGVLYGVEERDPGLLAGAVVVVLAVAVLAALLPARRASRIDPMVALRSE